MTRSKSRIQAKVPRRAARPVPSHPAGPTLGIIGGGQLARMLAQAASRLGCATVILEREAGVPAAQVTDAVITGDWNEPGSLVRLGRRADVVTLENEFVDAHGLASLEKTGRALWPSAATIDAIQDKLRQREVLVAAGLPVPCFAAVPDRRALAKLGEMLGWPIMVKRRRNGYDGKGNFTLRSAAEIGAAWRHLGAVENSMLAEVFCRYRKELAVMVCRGRDGSIATYPVVETVQRDHICHIVSAPAAIDSEIAQRAVDIARRAVDAFGGVGCFGVELFLMPDGDIVINELAPRVHNSGHYSMEACACSQFENHVRAVLGWPLGSTAMVAPAAVMINLLGASGGSGRPHGLERALAIQGAHVHVYGKARSARGRKMGHVTALGATVGEAMRRARRAARLVRFGDVS
ncbi:MAG: 5-(carboxyamino)imidazole ribonucleotide synthase [Opitutaceae bacterium]|nr:5-(carboxyamino)imidazole ribonucleotide synthase [Opitutaceae bacterium]